MIHLLADPWTWAPDDRDDERAVLTPRSGRFRFDIIGDRVEAIRLHAAGASEPLVALAEAADIWNDLEMRRSLEPMLREALGVGPGFSLDEESVERLLDAESRAAPHVPGLAPLPPLPTPAPTAEPPTPNTPVVVTHCPYTVELVATNRMISQVRVDPGFAQMALARKSDKVSAAFCHLIEKEGDHG